MHSFEVFGWFTIDGDFNLTSPETPSHIQGIEVSPQLLASTGISPVAGHVFTESEGPNVAVISHSLFIRLGSRIIGKPVTLNGKSYTVMGAMPARFRFPLVTVNNQDSHNDVWLPLAKPKTEDELRHVQFFAGAGRFKPDVTLGQVASEAKLVATQIQRLNHPNNPTFTAAVLSLQETVVKSVRPILLLLLGAAGLLLLICCANVAGLLVSRAVGRARETAIRVALGASQKQLALQYFLESLWVSIAGAFAGVLASILFVRAGLSLAADYIPRSDEISLDWQVLLFALVLAFLTATLAALAPLWQALRTQPYEVLSDGVRASAGVRTRKLSQALVIAEIVLAFTLLSAGAVLVWEFRSLQQMSPGFDPNQLLTFELTLSADQTANSEQTTAYIDRVIEALEAIPGVNRAAVANQIPLAGCCYSTSLFPERSTSINLHQAVSFNVVSSGYFKTMAIPLLAGREMNVHDTNEKLLPIVIDEAAAKRYWPNRNAVGEIARLGGESSSRVQIVGIVGTVPNEGLDKPPRPEVYLIYNVYLLQSMHFVVRSTLQPTGLVSAIRRAVAQINPSQPIYAFQPMLEVVNSSLMFQRIEWVVISFFALAALIMAAIGIYGLMSYSCGACAPLSWERAWRSALPEGKCSS